MDHIEKSARPELFPYCAYGACYAEYSMTLDYTGSEHPPRGYLVRKDSLVPGQPSNFVVRVVPSTHPAVSTFWTASVAELLHPHHVFEAFGILCSSGRCCRVPCHNNSW